jgi:hypothetical protein
MSKRAPRTRAASPRASGIAKTPPFLDGVPVAGTAGRALLTSRQLGVLQHTAGNRAVGRLLRAARQDRGTAVQRWAWVSAAQVDPADTSLDPKMKALASDKLVHDYGSDAEFRGHAAGKTDYLGNLPGPVSTGTWVRFAPTGTNLLGEYHTQVTLEHVLAAVGSKSFIYEPISVDVMPADSAMRKVYEAENKDRFTRFGIGGVPDKRQFGAESLFPKMGFALNELLPYITPPGDFADLKPGAYFGQPAQRYVKIAWGHAKDVAAEVKILKKQKKPVPAPLEDLAKVYKATKGTLKKFITGLPVDGYLGDALDTRRGKKVLPALHRFCTAFVAAMLARAGTDTDLTGQERTNLAATPQTTDADKKAVFAKWRNLHFSHAVRDAAQRGVRYAGMGMAHLTYLNNEGLPPNSQGYDMAGKEIADFETLTKNLAASVKSP